jgi:hypothetical protein
MEWMVKYKTISASLQGISFFGFADIASLQSSGHGVRPIHGCVIEYSPNDSNKFRLVTAASSVRTFEAGTTVVAADTWYRVGFVLTQTGGTYSVQMKVNGSNEGSPITTNLGTNSLAFGMRNEGEGNETEVYADYALVTQTLGDRED